MPNISYTISKFEMINLLTCRHLVNLSNNTHTGIWKRYTTPVTQSHGSN